MKNIVVLRRTTKNLGVFMQALLQPNDANMDLDADALAIEAAARSVSDDSLEAAVLRNLDRYFENLQGTQPHPLHPMVIAAVEKPLLIYAMKYTGHNKCEAAKLLGINRNTLHKKLKMYDLM